MIVPSVLLCLAETGVRYRLFTYSCNSCIGSLWMHGSGYRGISCLRRITKFFHHFAFYHKHALHHPRDYNPHNFPYCISFVERPIPLSNIPTIPTRAEVGLWSYYSQWTIKKLSSHQSRLELGSTCSCNEGNDRVWSALYPLSGRSVCGLHYLEQRRIRRF